MKAIPIRFVLSNPRFHLLARELSGRRQLAALFAQSRCEEQQQFLLLSRRQRIGS